MIYVTAYLKQLDDVGVANEFQNVDFPRDPLDVSGVANLLLLQHLDCDFFLGRNVVA